MRCAKWVLNNDRMSKISILPCCREKTSELLLDRKKTTARKKCPTPYLIALTEAPTLEFSFFLDSVSTSFWPFFKIQNLVGSNRFRFKHVQQSDMKSFHGKLMAEVTSVRILSMSMLAKILQSERKECKYFEASSCGHGSPRGTQSP